MSGSVPDGAAVVAASAGADRREELVARLRGFVADGRLIAAGALLPALEAAGHAGPDLVALRAEAACLAQQPDEALAALNAAIGGAWDCVALRLCRARLRLRLAQPQAAAQDAAEAVLRAPRDSAAKACLGEAMLALGHSADALSCLAEAAADASDPAVLAALAQAQAACRDMAAAAQTLQQAIARFPANLSLRTAAVMLHLRLRDHAGAEALALAAWRDGVADACLLGLLGHARSSLGRHAEAAQAYAEARKLGPEDPYVRHLAATADLSATALRAAPDYVEVVFDGYADRFDAHLASLCYRMPALLRAELDRRPEARLAPVLDLGCGTGLVGAALVGLGLAPLVGVDLSSRMLARARARGLYAELHHADIDVFLDGAAPSFPLILAADVLPYFGDLRRLFGRIAAHLRPGGLFLGSVEQLAAAGADEGWRLGRLGRYAHAPEHVRAAAVGAGLRMAMEREETIRLEALEPVTGLLIGLERPA